MKAILRAKTQAGYDPVTVKAAVKAVTDDEQGDEISFDDIRQKLANKKTPDGHIHQALIDLDIKVEDE